MMAIQFSHVLHFMTASGSEEANQMYILAETLMKTSELPLMTSFSTQPINRIMWRDVVLHQTDRDLTKCVHFLINKQEVQGVFQNIKYLCNIRALQIGAFV